MTEKQTGFVLRQVGEITAPTLVCESCGDVIQNLGMAWVMWPEPLENGASVRPTVLCKKNRCNSKPPYDRYPSMEMRDYLINLCRNSGIGTEKDFREAFELARLGEQV
jgi:hypothetical protein